MTEHPPSSDRSNPPAPVADVCDVVVIGAGPAGIAAAIHLHWLGLSVEVFDKARFPRDKCCGDGLTTLALRELERLQFHLDTVVDLHPMYSSMRLVAPSGAAIDIPIPSERDGMYAAIAPRIHLDDALVRHARNLGVIIHDGWAFESMTQERTYTTVTVTTPTGADADGNSTRRSIRSRYVVAADGAWSPVRKAVDAAVPEYRGDWQAMRQYASGVTGPAAHQMTIWFEADLLPGYAWSFPLPNGRANLGLGVLRNQGRTGADLAELWRSVWQRRHVRAALGTDLAFEGRHTAWPIPARIDGVPLSAHRVLFVGDAAAATDVLTGEGIGQALLTGRLAAEAIRVGGSADAHTVAGEYKDRVTADLFADHRMSRRLGTILSTPTGAERSLAIVARSGSWGRRNFARWLLEDEPRSILLTPRRWHRRFLARPGAFRAGPQVRASR